MSAVTAGRESLTVGQYADLVRAALTWLSPEQLEDLTDGLEADLADSLADPTVAGASGADLVDLVARFGSPEDYAAELASAAGWERPAATSGLRRSARQLGADLRLPVDSLVAALRAQPWWPAFAGFMVSLRPVWWVLRAWVPVAWVTGNLTNTVSVIPSRPIAVLALIGATVLSVQWGRGRIALGRWGRVLAHAVGVLAAILALPMLAMAGSSDGYAVQPVAYETVEVEPEAGVWVDGMQVSNLFVYDAEGELIDGAQIFDDRGREVRTMSPEADGYTGEWSFPGSAQPWSFVPTTDDRGVERWNVYPLHGATWDNFTFDDRTGSWGLPSGVQAVAPPSPFGAAPMVSARITTEAPVDEPPAEAPDQPSAGADAGQPSTGAAEQQPSAAEEAEADEAEAGDGEPSATGTAELEEAPSPTATP